MADKTIVVTPDDVNKIISDYAKQKMLAAQIAVELSGVNELDPLTLLRIMSIKEPGADDLAPACELMLDGRSISFTLNGKEIWGLSYNRGSGNSLQLMFTDKPYLYDILQQTIYALLLKKLTPHLEGSN
jgi:hypothetical protein